MTAAGGPPQPGPGPPPPISVIVEVTLPGATVAAQSQLSKAIQDYADRLARESETQEISNRPPGVHYAEVTVNSVARAKTVLDRYGQRAKASGGDVAALMGVPIFSGATGVMGSYLHSAWQWSVFSASAFFTVVCLAYLARRRML